MFDFLLTLLNENQFVLIGAAIAFIVAGANLLTMFVPSVSKNPVYSKVMGFLNVLALNIVKNKNADAN